MTRRHKPKHEDGFGMFKDRRWVGPVFAVQALRLHWAGKRELDAASSRQAGQS